MYYKISTTLTEYNDDKEDEDENDNNNNNDTK